MDSFRESPLEPCTEVGSSISFYAPTALSPMSMRVGNVYYVQLQTQTEWKYLFKKTVGIKIFVVGFHSSSPPLRDGFAETLTGTFMTSPYVSCSCAHEPICSANVHDSE